jgi:acyl transferase domain-containing protein/acyl carrier protein
MSEELASNQQIAIIGYAGRFPGAPTVDALWDNLKSGKESVTFYTDEELAEAGVSKGELENPDYVKAAGLIDEPAMFDAGFFTISPKEAEYIDPQQRIFLECAQHALEDAGCDPLSYEGRIGIFGGSALSKYQSWAMQSNAEELRNNDNLRTMFATGVANDYLVTRVAYKLKFRGPAVTVQTACSTSLVAMHMASESILAGESDIALAGGVSIQSSYRKGGYTYSENGMVSPDGRCRPFDAKAKGTIFSDGVGIVVLKRLDRALADGDSIRAVIRGIAINNDGSDKVSFAAPAVPGQTAVISKAINSAKIDPDAIDYVEAHGTATAIGDPIEFAALSNVFASGRRAVGTCVLGSLKGNIGHLNHASGVAGAIKIAKAFENEIIPGTPTFESPNEALEIDKSVFRVTKEATEWKRRETPRRASINNFGIGGTNVHAVLEEPPVATDEPSKRRLHILPVTGKSQKGADETLKLLGAYLEGRPKLNIADAAHTLLKGRASYRHARAVVCRDAAHAAQTIRNMDMRSLASGERRSAPLVAFMFPGQGAQRLAMGGGLYRGEPMFAAAVDRCAELFAPHIGMDLRTLINVDRMTDAAASVLTETRIAQPALFTVSWALAELWRSLGVTPNVLIGHSIGELVAAAVSGVFSLEDAVFLVAKRGELMQAQRPGVMSAVPASVEFVREWLTEGVEIAAINGPGACVVSGDASGVSAFEVAVRDQGIFCTRLRTSHAFHSASMQDAATEFVKVVNSVPRHAPGVPFVSNVTGDWITDEQAASGEYWGSQLRSAVNYCAGAETVAKRGVGVYVECGPGRTLTSLTRQAVSRANDLTFVASIPTPDGTDSEAEGFLRAVAQVWSVGVNVDLAARYSGEARRKIPLAPYAFQREKYWAVKDDKNREPSRELPKAPEDMALCTFVPTWLREDAPAPEPAEGAWLVFVNDDELSRGLVETLRKTDGVHLVTVAAGEVFSKDDNDSYTIVAKSSEHFSALFRDLSKSGLLPNFVVYLWSAGAEGLAQEDEALERAFFGITHVVQQLSDTSTPVNLTTVTAGAFDVLGGEDVIPEGSLAIGPTLTGPLERIALSTRMIDLPADGAKSRRYAAALARDAAGRKFDAILAYRRSSIWSCRFKLDPSIVSDAVSAPASDGRTYLLTGGTGDLGMAIAEGISEYAKVNFILSSRRGLPERDQWDNAEVVDPKGPAARLIHRIRAIEAKGSKVIVCAADASDREAMVRVIERARETFGGIDGVFHMAGVPGGSPMLLKSREETDKVLASKYYGTKILAEALKDRELDFFVLFSSIAALTGGVGQADYASGNAYMDAVANAPGVLRAKRVVSINWDAWRDIGMAATTEMPTALLEAWHRELLEFGIAPEGGIRALLAILASKHPQVLVCRRVTSFNEINVNRAGSLNLRKALPKMEAGEKAKKVEAVGERYKRPQLSVEYVAPRNEIEQTVAEFWGATLNIDHVGINDDFFELGGHSLLALQLVPKLRNHFKLDFVARDIFENTESLTIARISEMIAEKLSNAQTERPELEVAAE